MLRLSAHMISCRVRDEIRGRTLSRLFAAGWQGTVSVELDEPAILAPLERHMALVRSTLRRVANAEPEMFLFLEDDLDFGLHFSYNLARWLPLLRFSRNDHFFASLYNPGVRLLKLFPESAYGEACTESVFGSQALLISRATARYLVTCWGVESCANADLKIARLAARVCPLLYHVPSLVQHVGTKSLWGGPSHCAADFDRNWKAPAVVATTGA
jgi:hypothetical protein